MSCHAGILSRSRRTKVSPRTTMAGYAPRARTLLEEYYETLQSCSVRLVALQDVHPDGVTLPPREENDNAKKQGRQPSHRRKEAAEATETTPLVTKRVGRPSNRRNPREASSLSPLSRILSDSHERQTKKKPMTTVSGVNPLENRTYAGTASKPATM